MADQDLQLKLRINALVKGAKEVDRLTKEIRELTQAGGKKLPDNAKGFRGGVQSAIPVVGGLRNMVVGLGGALAVFQGFRLATQALREFVREGVQYNASLEQGRLGIATLIAAQSKLTDSNGNALKGQEALSAAMKVAENQLGKLEIAGLETAATGEQLRDAFQQAIGTGLSAGLDLDEIRNITIQIVQAAGALGVPMNQVSQEVRTILEGTIDMNARIAKSLGITNAMVKDWKAQGTLAEELNKRLETFSLAGAETAKTWGAIVSNIEEAVSKISGVVVEPLFESAKTALGDVFGQVFDVSKDDKISDTFRGLVEAGQEVATEVGDLLGEALAWVVIKAEELSAWLKENKAAVRDTVTEAGRFLRQVGVLLAKGVEVTAQIVKWNAETRTLSGLFRILGYAVAGIQDQFSILGAVVTGIGIALVNSVLYPIEKTIEGLSWLVEHAHVLPGLGGMADVDFSPLKRLSEDLGGIREEITAKGWDFIGGIADRFQRGESAVMRFHKSLSETKKTLEDMAAGEAKAEGPLPTITPKGAGEGTKTKESAEEKAIKKAIAALREKAATLGYTSRQEALYKLMLKGATDAQLEEADALLASIEKFNLAEEIRKGQIEANNRAIDQAREEAEAIRDILDPLREIERQIARIWELSRGGFLSPEEAQARIEQIRAEWKVATDDMTKLGMGFAQSFQQALGEFLYDPFKDGVKGMLSSFVDMIRKMVAEALAAQIMQKLLGSYGQTGQMGGWVGMLMSAFSSRHSGGLVHEGGPQRRVSPTVFIGAPRLHAGGMLGLKPGEVPIVAKRGEEVLTRDDPRHAANGGGPGGGAGGVRILNVIDPDLVHDYLQSSSGEKVLLNVIQKNAGNIKQVLA